MNYSIKKVGMLFYSLNVIDWWTYKLQYISLFSNVKHASKKIGLLSSVRLQHGIYCYQSIGDKGLGFDSWLAKFFSFSL